MISLLLSEMFHSSFESAMFVTVITPHAATSLVSFSLYQVKSGPAFYKAPGSSLVAVMVSCMPFSSYCTDDVPLRGAAHWYTSDDIASAQTMRKALGHHPEGTAVVG